MIIISTSPTVFRRQYLSNRNLVSGWKIQPWEDTCKSRSEKGGVRSLDSFDSIDTEEPHDKHGESIILRTIRLIRIQGLTHQLSHQLNSQATYYVLPSMHMTNMKSKRWTLAGAPSIAGAFNRCRRNGTRKGKAEVVEAVDTAGRPSRTIGTGTSSGNDDHPLSTCKPDDDLAVFGDDVLLLILSFVSYAPYENGKIPWVWRLRVDAHHLRLYSDYMKGQANPSSSSSSRSATLLRSRHSRKRDKCNLQIYSFSTLTHVLPLVCKRFSRLCSGSSSGTLWLQALKRLVADDPGAWLGALWAQSQEIDEVRNLNDIFGWSKKKTSDVVAAAYSHFTSPDLHAVGDHCARSFFKHLFIYAEPKIFPCTLPLVHNKNQAPPKVGARYRLVISDPNNIRAIRFAMGWHSMAEWKGNEVDDDDCLQRWPRFLYNYGFNNPCVDGDPVLLVEIRQCRMQPDDHSSPTHRPLLNDRIHLTIVPIMYVRLSDVHENMTFARGALRNGRQYDPSFGATLFRPIRSRYQRQQTSKVEAMKIVSAPMIRAFSTVAPQLGMEFVIKDIINARFERFMTEMTSGLRSFYVSTQATFHPKLPRPVIIYTCQPDRWMPLGEGVRGEDAFVVELRLVKVIGPNRFSIRGVPVQLGVLLGPDNEDEASVVSIVSVKINVELGSFGPKLI